MAVQAKPTSPWTSLLTRTVSAVVLAAVTVYACFAGGLVLASFWSIVCTALFIELMRTVPLDFQRIDPVEYPHYQGVDTEDMLIAGAAFVFALLLNAPNSLWSKGLGGAIIRLKSKVVTLLGPAAESYALGGLLKDASPAALLRIKDLALIVLITQCATVLLLRAHLPASNHARFFFTAALGIFLFAGCAGRALHTMEIDRMFFAAPLLYVSVNDIMAYIWGRTLGRRRLLEVSPNKTIEGYIGAAVSTVVLAIATGPPLMIKFSDGLIESISETPELQSMLSFRLSAYVMILSIWISIVGPAGGFAASMYKRVIGIKDFGNSIPGHGGFLDRFDCHILLSIFNEYLVRAFFYSEN